MKKSQIYECPFSRSLRNTNERQSEAEYTLETKSTTKFFGILDFLSRTCSDVFGVSIDERYTVYALLLEKLELFFQNNT